MIGLSGTKNALSEHALESKESEGPDPLPRHASRTGAGISRRARVLIKRCGGVAPELMQYDI